MNSTIDLQEVEKFSRIADEWWDEAVKFKPLHKFNPIRISYIRKKIIEHFSLDQKSLKPFSNFSLDPKKFEEMATQQQSQNSNFEGYKLKILDVGCGGGLIAEPFARMGADVTAIDASEKNIAVAKIHAEKSGLKIDYRAVAAENLNEKFDVVFALEIIEHVADVEAFIKSCAQLVKPNGLLFVATMNRTIKSLALAKIAVEYVLRWLPAGTHDWKKFLKPSEINFYAARCGLDLQELKGFSYNILNDEWKEVENLDVNYIAVFTQR